MFNIFFLLITLIITYRYNFWQVCVCVHRYMQECPNTTSREGHISYYDRNCICSLPIQYNIIYHYISDFVLFKIVRELFAKYHHCRHDGSVSLTIRVGTLAANSNSNNNSWCTVTVCASDFLLLPKFNRIAVLNALALCKRGAMKLAGQRWRRWTTTVRSGRRGDAMDVSGMTIRGRFLSQGCRRKTIQNDVK